MRDVNRLDHFYAEMKRIHAENFPDWRFGQLMMNFFAVYTSKGDPFFWEEDAFLENLRDYVEKCTQNSVVD